MCYIYDFCAFFMLLCKWPIQCFSSLVIPYYEIFIVDHQIKFFVLTTINFFSIVIWRDVKVINILFNWVFFVGYWLTSLHSVYLQVSLPCHELACLHSWTGDWLINKVKVRLEWSLEGEKLAAGSIRYFHLGHLII